MKKLLSVFLAAVFISGMMLVTVSANEDEILGVWRGSYGQNAGETGATLTVTRSGRGLTGIWEFYNLRGRSNAKSGSYYMDVSYNPANGHYSLKAREWIERPSGYVTLDFEGMIDRNIFSGQIANSNYVKRPFRLTRVDY